jgi:hypothetical protein
MTDFVDRLLGRREVPAIRPLIPTMFEPLSMRADDEPLPMGAFSESGNSVAAEPARRGDGFTAPTRPPGRTPATEKFSDSQPPHSHHTHDIERVITERHTYTVTSDTPQRPPSTPAGTPTELNATAPQPVSMADSIHQTVLRGLPTPSVTPVTLLRRGTTEPDIHISIGRVEITAPPARPSSGRNAARSTKRPQLSLDDYLRSREADRR